MLHFVHLYSDPLLAAAVDRLAQQKQWWLEERVTR